ncbi:hypothetical protein FB451DRAFT_1173405 [Mycena latifolia]|nr:hypothetical protein FB451DRAFT_1173405 [Mycena latifolia]
MAVAIFTAGPTIETSSKTFKLPATPASSSFSRERLERTISVVIGDSSSGGANLTEGGDVGTLVEDMVNAEEEGIPNIDVRVLGRPINVCNEWEANNIDPDLQVHILTAIYGSKTSPNAMRHILDILNIQHDPPGSVKTYRKQLRAYILTLRKGKRVEREQQGKTDAITRFNEQLQKIRESWPQLVPQSLKDKIITEFREMTSSEALTTFTCASCAEAIPLRSHFSLSITEFDCEILKRPDLVSNDELLLDRFKWLIRIVCRLHFLLMKET